MKGKVKVKVDIQAAINHYNEKNPNKRKLFQNGLVERLKTDVDSQIFTKWKNKAPNSFAVIKEVSSITGYPLNKLINTEHE